MKEFLKYLGAGLFVALIWVIFGGIEWESSSARADRANKAYDQALLRSEIKTLREKVRASVSPGEVALAVEDLRKAEAKLAD